MNRRTHHKPKSLGRILSLCNNNSFLRASASNRLQTSTLGGPPSSLTRNTPRTVKENLSMKTRPKCKEENISRLNSEPILLNQKQSFSTFSGSPSLLAKNSSLGNSNNNINQNFVASSCNGSYLLEYTLKSLGIDECYFETFYANKITFEDLMLLTREDLKEMNIPIGPRNRLLNFINKFGTFINGASIDNNFSNPVESVEKYFNCHNRTISFNENEKLQKENGDFFGINSNNGNIFSSQLNGSTKMEKKLKNNNPHNSSLVNERPKMNGYDELVKIKEKLQSQLNYCNQSIREKKKKLKMLEVANEQNRGHVSGTTWDK